MKLEKNVCRGVLIRSRARWIEKSEKPSSYFFNLENRNFVSKQMRSITKDNGEEIFELEHIKKEVHSFYQKLYCSREDSIKYIDLDSLLEGDTPKLDNNDALSLEGPISLNEASKVLDNMKNNKSPGSDGFTVEFFKFFLEIYRFFSSKFTKLWFQ